MAPVHWQPSLFCFEQVHETFQPVLRNHGLRGLPYRCPYGQSRALSGHLLEAADVQESTVGAVMRDAPVTVPCLTAEAERVLPAPVAIDCSASAAHPYWFLDVLLTNTTWHAIGVRAVVPTIGGKAAASCFCCTGGRRLIRQIVTPAAGGCKGVPQVDRVVSYALVVQPVLHVLEPRPPIASDALD